MYTPSGGAVQPRASHRGSKDRPSSEWPAPLDLNDWAVGTRYAGKAPEQRWLVKGTIPLGQAGLLTTTTGFKSTLAMLDVAMAIAAPRGATPNSDRVRLGIPEEASGSAALMFGIDGREELHRQVDALNPLGNRWGEWCRDRCHIATVYGRPPDEATLFTRDSGWVAPTPFADGMFSKLFGLNGLRLIVLSPLQSLVSVNLADSQMADGVYRQLQNLAVKTGATVIATRWSWAQSGGLKCKSSPWPRGKGVRRSLALADGETRFSYAYFPAKTEQAYSVLGGAHHLRFALFENGNRVRPSCAAKKRGT